MVGQDIQAWPPLDCAAVEANLMAYLKGGLAPAVDEALRAHLLRCERCTDAVQEARALDAALYAEAPQRLYDVPPHFSAQVQAHVYRRMRRALVLQRTRDFTGRVATLVVSLLFIVALVVLLGPWLRHLAIVEATPTQSAPTVGQGPPVPTPGADTQAGLPLDVEPPRSLGERRTVALATEFQSPADGARDLMQAAIAGDEQQVRSLLVGTRARASRVLARLQACEGVIAAGDLRYQGTRYGTRFAGVRVYYGEHLAGEIRMVLREDGYWYLHFLDYDAFTILGHGCLAEP